MKPAQFVKLLCLTVGYRAIPHEKAWAMEQLWAAKEGVKSEDVFKVIERTTAGDRRLRSVLKKSLKEFGL
jgi:hypothetical protein